MSLARIKSIPASQTAILLVDVQNSEIDDEHKRKLPWYYNQIMNVCLPNMKRVIDVGRSLGMEIMYTTIESLTADGRDRSLDHKLSNIFIPKNSYLGQVIHDVAPLDDDIWLKKTSSGVFNSTNIDYLLRNLQINYLVIMGMLTDQCVDMAVRDAADKGYNVICIDDACTTHTKQRHENALSAFKGYCTILNTEQFIQKVQEYNSNLKNVTENCPTVKHIVQSTSLTTLVTTDLIGITRGRSVPTYDLEKYFKTGCGWVPADSALTPQDVIADANRWGSHGDLRLLPDKNSRVQIANGPDSKSTPLDYIHCDIVETDGQIWDCCPRGLLKREMQYYQNKLGMKINVAFEHEFTLMNKTDTHPAQPSFSLRSQRQQNQFSSWLMSSLQAAHVQPEMFLSEYGPNQYEVTYRPSDPLTAADRAVNIREITRDIARQLDLTVSFAPLTSVNGISNGVHLHISIDDLNGKPLFYDENRPFNLSTIGEHWSAGVLHHLAALCAITAPTPVSYLRLKPRHWSSAYGCVGYRNREAPIRICPTVDFDEETVPKQYNLEYRPMDGTSSPHLSLACILFAGRYGIEKKLALKSILTTDPHLLDEKERNNKDIFSLPTSLKHALEMLKNNRHFREYLPVPLLETYLAVKNQELSIINQFDDQTLCEHYARIY
ncbi:unnamed protein product [Adineta ricciae]|uniref:GS catalytic domain-containing protein n=1 Tax=Adineta ricciae TaxID=249248 RepID=A0A814MYF1_ADIRI|nr:unnamed protein product [Adineta ricciae]